MLSPLATGVVPGGTLAGFSAAALLSLAGLLEVGPGAAGAAPGEVLALSSASASVFLRAPRRSASRRRAAWATFSTLAGSTMTSGWMPVAWMERPDGVK